MLSAYVIVSNLDFWVYYFVAAYDSAEARNIVTWDHWKEPFPFVRGGHSRAPPTTKKKNTKKETNGIMEWAGKI